MNPCFARRERVRFGGRRGYSLSGWESFDFALFGCRYILSIHKSSSQGCGFVKWTASFAHASITFWSLIALLLLVVVGLATWIFYFHDLFVTCVRFCSVFPSFVYWLLSVKGGPMEGKSDYQVGTRYCCMTMNSAQTHAVSLQLSEHSHSWTGYQQGSYMSVVFHCHLP